MSAARTGVATGRILVVGAGQVGRSLVRALRRIPLQVTLSPRRKLVIPKSVAVVICAVRDGQLQTLAGELVARLPAKTPVLHCAGGLGLEALQPLRPGHPVGVMHPLLSFSGPRTDLSRGTFLVWGDPAAVRVGGSLGKALGAHVIKPSKLHPARYHAAAALAANGSVALAFAASELMAQAGVPRADVARTLSGLLESVATNLGTLGPAAALTGPVRRGDDAAILRHLSAISSNDAKQIYRDSVSAQLALMRSAAGRKLRASGCDEQGLERIVQMIDRVSFVGPPSKSRTVRAKRASTVLPRRRASSRRSHTSG